MIENETNIYMELAKLAIKVEEQAYNIEVGDVYLNIACTDTLLDTNTLIR